MRPVSLRAARRHLRRDRPRGDALLRAALLGAGLVLIWAALVSHPWWGRTVQNVSGVVQHELGLELAELEVHGTARLAPAAVQRALGVEAGTPLLPLDLDAARARVEALDWVATASVRRELPNRLIVTLNEHEPRAVWLGETGPALVAEGGATLSLADITVARELPRLLGSGDPPAVEPVLRALRATPTLRARLERFERVGGRRWRVWLAPGVRVELPANDVGGALARLAALQSREAILDRAVAAIDLRLADRLVVTPAPRVREASG